MALKVIDVLRQFLPEFLKTKPSLSGAQWRAIRAITNCRTSAIGGHLYTCDKCGDRAFAYHSCNHNACPQCGRDATRKWVERELGKRINAPYFMVTFTLPTELRGLFFGVHAKEAYDLFFKASAAALSEKLAMPKFLGAKVSGFTGVLHTWNQRLLFHPHIHFIVPGAGINARGDVVKVKKGDYLVHVQTLAKAFQHHFRQGLEEKEWGVDPDVRCKEWRINIKDFGAGNNVIKYLGRYVHRIAIGDRRIKAITDDSITFEWKDRKDGDKLKLKTVPGIEFVKRYLRLVTPQKMGRIRYFGFCHPAAKRKREHIRFHTGIPLEIDPPKPAEEKEERALGIPTCPCCQKPMKKLGSFRRYCTPRAPPARMS